MNPFSIIAAAVKAVVMLIRLIIFAVCLLPGFIRVAIWYLRSANVKRNIKYGPRSRNYLDLYAPPPSSDTKHPMMVFISGGAWMIGNKAWGALLGKVLKARGVMCVMPDYRNFPQGRVNDMLEDVKASVKWAFDNADKFGGDPERIFLVGQSAGAHLSAVAMIQQAKV